MKLLIVIPALNEAASVANVVSRCIDAWPDSDVLVVDDGSNDDTRLFAAQAGAQVAVHPFNMGVGAALRTGFRFAVREGHTHVVQIDADGQHDPHQVTQLLKFAGTHQVVIGSRFAHDKPTFEVNVLRRLAMRWLARWTSKICRTQLSDVTSGFRLSTRPAIELFAEEYPPEYLGDTVESLVIAHRAGLSIVEVPVEMNQREHGKPSQSTIKAMWYVGRALLVLLLAVLHGQKDFHHFTSSELAQIEEQS